MLELLDTRVYSGHTGHGPPPVLRFELRSANGSGAVDHRAVLSRLEARGLAGTDNPDVAAEAGLAPAVALFAEVLGRLLRHGGHPPGSINAATHGETADATVWLPCEDVATAEKAGHLALRLLAGDLNQDAIDEGLEAFLSAAATRLPDPNARLLARAARARGLPVMRLDQPPMETRPDEDPLPVGLIQVGHGVHGYSFAGPLPSSTDRETVEALADRRHVVSRLVDAGLPVARQDLEFPNKRQPRRAARAADRLGFPVVIRPVVRPAFAYRHSALAVYADLHEREAVERAFEAAAGAERGEVWVEGQHPGTAHRFLIVDGRVRAVARCEPPTIQGDGRSTVTELITARADGARDRNEQQGWLSIARGDRDVATRLALAGADGATVPHAGQRVPLRGVGTPYNGGICQDVTATVAEAIKRVAEAAAAACGLRTPAGVEMAIVATNGAATPDNCVVLDVLPDPDLVTHSDAPTDVADALLAALIPRGSARVPMCSITGTNGKTTTTQMLAHILRQAGDGVAVATTQGTAVDDERLATGDLAGVTGAGQVLTDPRTRVAVLETARGGLIRLGAPYDHCDVGVCLNVQEDHLGVDGVATLDQMAVVKGEVIRRTTGTAVLNADDPRTLGMIDARSAESVILVSARQSSAVGDHCRRGGRAVCIRSGIAGEASRLVVHDGERTEALIDAASIPATVGGSAGFNTSNAAFAAAAALACGMSLTSIRNALSTFESDFERNPGRLNVYDTHPFRVVVDYAHNPHAWEAVCRLIDAMPVAGRRHLVFCAAGDRSDVDLEAIGRAVAGHFDHYVCTNYNDLRGRNPDEVPALLRRGLVAAGVAQIAISVEPERYSAMDGAFHQAGEGDVVTIVAGHDDAAVRRFIREWPPG